MDKDETSGNRRRGALPKERKRYSGDLKARIALEAIKGQRTLNEIAGHYEVSPTQVNQWKKQALDELPGLFTDKRLKAEQNEEAVRGQLYQQIMCPSSSLGTVTGKQRS